MYLLLIHILILAVPLIVMPRYIIQGYISPYRTVLQATIAVAASATVVFIAASMTGEGLFSQIHEMVRAISREAASNSAITEMFDMGSADLQERTEMLTNLYDNLFAMLPSYIITVGAVVSYIEYIILSKIIGRKRQVVKMPKFREFSFPGGALTGVVIMYLLTWVMTQSGIFTNNMMYINMDFLFDFTFSIQGVSVVLMFCHMKRMPYVLGIIIAVILWMTLIGRAVLVMTGMIDLMFGLKGKIRGREIKK